MINATPLKRTTRLILHYVGLLLHVPGIMALLSIVICLGFGEFYAIKSFLETAIASLIPALNLFPALRERVCQWLKMPVSYPIVYSGGDRFLNG